MIPALLSRGFRPFFLASGLYAVLAMAAWLAMLSGLAFLPIALDPLSWHSHEMLYGFAAAAVTGFLMTVTPNWTRTDPIRGLLLAGLVGVWLAGRIVHWISGLLPVGLVTSVDLLFLAFVIVLVSQPILAQRNRRQMIFIPILCAYWLGNLLIHLKLFGVEAIRSDLGPKLGVYALATLITVMGGRIIPSFASNYLRARGAGVRIGLEGRADRVVLWITPTLLGADLLLTPGPVTGVLFLILAVVHLRRWIRWRPIASRGEPILWVLHTGYAWLVASFAFISLADLAHLLPRTAALHGMTVGAVGLLMLGIMSRAALGHTGRPIRAAPSMVFAYLLLNGAVLLRVISLAVPGPADPRIPLLLSGALWIGSFAIFVYVYAPILVRPRVDGRPG